jgi:hypothetical protein
MVRYPGRRAPSAPLALGWYASRFQRFCRFAAEMHDEKRQLG